MSRKNILLACTKCRMKNYKMPKSTNERLELKKYCKICREHTNHKEEK